MKVEELRTLLLGAESMENHYQAKLSKSEDETHMLKCLYHNQIDYCARLRAVIKELESLEISGIFIIRKSTCISLEHFNSWKYSTVMTPKKLTLEQFVRRYSQANQTEYDVLKAACTKLDPKSGAYQAAMQCMEKWEAFEQYLESAGFEL